MASVPDYSVPVKETYQLEGWEFDLAADHFFRNENVEVYEDEGSYSELRATTQRRGKKVVWNVVRDGTVTWLEVSTELDLEEFVDQEESWENYLCSMTDDRVDSIQKRSREVYGLN